VCRAMQTLSFEQDKAWSEVLEHTCGECWRRRRVFYLYVNDECGKAKAVAESVCTTASAGMSRHSHIADLEISRLSIRPPNASRTCRITSSISANMPSRGNPNVPNKQKRKANRSKVQRRNAGKVVKNSRGTAASVVLHPTSGPAAPLSGKKARKVEKAINHARRRALEAAMVKEGEVFMTGIHYP
jgi:hypothetical protein